MVAKTTPRKISPSNFWEVLINEKLQIHVFTRPTQIKFAIKVQSTVFDFGYNTKLIDEICIDIPGQNANSITSSS